jgi:hypothetical protein
MQPRSRVSPTWDLLGSALGCVARTCFDGTLCVPDSETEMETEMGDIERPPSLFPSSLYLAQLLDQRCRAIAPKRYRSYWPVFREREREGAVHRERYASRARPVGCVTSRRGDGTGVTARGPMETHASLLCRSKMSGTYHVLRGTPRKRGDLSAQPATIEPAGQKHPPREYWKGRGQHGIPPAIRVHKGVEGLGRPIRNAKGQDSAQQRKKRFSDNAVVPTDLNKTGRSFLRLSILARSHFKRFSPGRSLFPLYNYLTPIPITQQNFHARGIQTDNPHVQYQQTPC